MRRISPVILTQTNALARINVDLAYNGAPAADEDIADYIPRNIPLLKAVGIR